MKQEENQKIKSGYDKLKRSVLRVTQSQYRERRCRCNVWWKTVPEVGARNWKSSWAWEVWYLSGRYGRQ